jgi:hypothetical protein
MTWHIPEPMALAYVSGDVHGARAASIEAHVMTCPTCRELVGREVPTDRLEAIWADVEELVDAPRPSWAERLLTVLGVPDTDARLMASAPSLHLSWLTAVAVVLAFAAWASQTGDRGLAVFLIVAPIVPVVAVAGAYGRWIDPTYEVSVSSSYPTLRLLLLRASAVVVASGVLAGFASLLVPDARVAAAWVLPCLALVTVTLALSRWLPLLWSAAFVAACYVLPLLSGLHQDANVLDLVISRGVQLTALLVAAAAVTFMLTDPQLRAALRRSQ